MPRAPEEVLEEAEKLADWFEQHGTSPENQQPVSQFFIGCIVDAVRLGDARDIAAAVLAARNARVSWFQIGDALNVSARDAEHRFGAVVELAQAARKKVRSATSELPPLGR